MAFARWLLVVVTLSSCTTSHHASPEPARPASRERFVRATELVVADRGETMPVDRLTAPRYPPAARQSGVEAQFFAVAVLDTVGRIEMPSVTFLGAAPDQFRGAVCDYYRRVALTPVIRDRQPRRALVVAPWVFALQGGALEGKQLDESGLRNALKGQGVAAYLPQLDSLPHCTR